MNIDLNLINYERMEKERALKVALFNFFGLEMQQVPNAVYKLNRLLNTIRPDKIVEFGVGMGGLSVLLNLWCCLNKKPYYGFEMCPEYIVFSPIIKAIGGKLFENDIINNEESKKSIGLLIGDSGKSLVLCDAGKVDEFNIYAYNLKPGDCIMMHDYVVSEENFQDNIKDKIWNFPMGKYSLIEKAVKDNDIEVVSYLEDCVWFCGVKK